MGMPVGGHRGALSSEPNVVPMIDILLVLLIIFMISQPLSRTTISVQVAPPTPPQQAKSESSNQIVLELGDGPARHPAARDLRSASGEAALREAGPQPEVPGRGRGDGRREGSGHPDHRVHAEGSVSLSRDSVPVRSRGPAPCAGPRVLFVPSFD